MSQNPYEPPRITEPIAVGVVSGRREDLRKVAQYQRGVIACLAILILVFISFGVIGPITDEFKLTVARLIAMVALATTISGVVFVFLLAIQLYSPTIGVVLGLIALIPCLNIVVLLILNSKATAVLRQNGI